MKSERNFPIKSSVENLKISCRSLCLKYCDNPDTIVDFLSEDDAIRSFPPDGKLLVSELDTFYLIMLGDGPVGFYRIEDLFFDGQIELHGSFVKHDTFLIRAYFELTTLFVKTISKRFPYKTICTTVLKNNAAVRKFLTYLGFIAVKDSLDSGQYIKYIKPR